LNPDAEIWLIEDNARIHSNAKHRNRFYIEENSIKYVPYPANSPDLHPIENCFDSLDEALQDYNVIGASQREILQAEQEVIRLWKEDPNMNKKILERMSLKTFATKADRCLKAKGRNNWIG
jgi:hypothetical protein